MIDLERPLRIGTRGSELALWQSHHVKGLLEAAWPGLQVELEIITTDGDRIQDRPLHEVGGKGLFVKGIEQRLIDAGVDLAVHSMKDMPAFSPEALVVACTPAREDPADALCGSSPDMRLATLPPGTRVGTGSLRRGALIRRINPHVELVPIRGNVPTRLRRVGDSCDAVVLAAAGLRRLGLGDRISESLDLDTFCPAPAQGILALQCRRDDERTRQLLEPLQDPRAAITARVERSFLERLEAGCTVPVGCHATLIGEHRVAVHALVIDPSGSPCYETRDEAAVADARQLGRAVAERLLAAGADAIVATDPLTPQA